MRIRIMAYQGKIIHNPVAGQQIRFLQTASDTAGASLEMESTYQPKSLEPPMHYHPIQTEDFTVLQGELTIRIHGELRILQQGETLHVPSGTSHAMWNASNHHTIVHWQVHPALETEYFLEMIYGLAAEGKCTDTGGPKLLQAIVTARKYHAEFRLSSPALFIQRMAFLLLSPIAWLAGYRGSYRRYLDQ